MRPGVIAEVFIPKEGRYLIVGDDGPDQSLLLLFTNALGGEIFSIGFLVKHFREKKDWSQRRLQEESGLPHSHICNIENGKIIPEHETVDRLGPALGNDFKKSVELAAALGLALSIRKGA